MKSIKQILKEDANLPVKEIMVRLNRGSIKLNNVVLSDLDMEIDAEGEGVELGDFLSSLPYLPRFFTMFDIKDYFGDGDTNIEWAKFLGEWNVVSAGKREHWVFRRSKKIGKLNVDEGEE